MTRSVLSIICALAFFGATAYGIVANTTPGTFLSFISGTCFIVGALMDLSMKRGKLASSDRIGLIEAKVEILKIKSDHYVWWSNLNDNDRAEMEKALAEIEQLLKESE